MEFIHFLSNSQGSASELETELLISYRSGFINAAEYELLGVALDEIGRMITGLSKHLKSKAG